MDLLSELKTANKLLETIIKKTSKLSNDNNELKEENSKLYTKIQMDRDFYDRQMYEMELNQQDKRSINAVFKYTLF